MQMKGGRARPRKTKRDVKVGENGEGGSEQKKINLTREKGAKSLLGKGGDGARGRVRGSADFPWKQNEGGGGRISLKKNGGNRIAKGKRDAAKQRGGKKQIEKRVLQQKGGGIMRSREREKKSREIRFWGSRGTKPKKIKKGRKKYKRTVFLERR